MKKSIIHRILFDAILFFSGGISYGIIELLWRRRTHISMILTGGVCFLALYRLYSRLKHFTMLEKCIVGSTLITIAEFICGCIVNIKLRLSVWDYSHIPLNLIGQICVLYSTLWGFLCIPVSILCNRIEKLTARRSLRLSCKQKQKQCDDF